MGGEFIFGHFRYSLGHEEVFVCFLVLFLELGFEEGGLVLEEVLFVVLGEVGEELVNLVELGVEGFYERHFGVEVGGVGDEVDGLVGCFDEGLDLFLHEEREFLI